VKKSFLIIVSMFFVFVSLSFAGNFLLDNKKEKVQPATTASIPTHVAKPKYVRGIHLSGWAAGSKKLRVRYEKIFKETEINTVVIAVKEASGEVFIKGIPKAEKIGAYINAMPDIKAYIDHLHSLGIYVIARQVLFKDPVFSKAEPSLAVRNPEGKVWRDFKGLSYADPFNKKVWEYNFSIADECVKLGFDEIQFDYIRYPSDGKIKECRYMVKYSTTVAVQNICDFLKEANRRYKDKKIRISADVFGLTTSAKDDLGIGQIIEKMEPYVDALYPMVYPSHYYKGTYNIKEPNKSPYETIYRAMKYGKEKLGNKSYKYIPYIQDFSLGYKYGVKEIKAQKQALYDNDIGEWVLWDPRAVYTIEALAPKSEASRYKKLRKDEPVVNKEQIKTSTVTVKVSQAKSQKAE
jgi:hypothetical protein